MSILVQEASLNKFVSLGTLISGAVVYDMEVRIFVMDEAVWAFRKDRYKDLKVDTSVPGYEKALKNGIKTGQISTWYEQIKELKEMGEVSIHLCSLCCAIDNLEKENFLDIVDSISNIGVYINDIIFEADKVVCL
jgi:peroxiredoxin family protein